jgi:hypothetical protein
MMPRRRRRTPTTDGAREHQLVSYAMDLAERQLIDGTASSQVLTHFLKAGSEREKLERKRLEQENAVLAAKVEAMAGAKRVEELYAQALDAMRTYAGRDPEFTHYVEEDMYYEDD